MSSHSCLAIVLALSVALAGPARAQTVAGELVDAAGAPVSAARIVLLTADGTTAASALSDRDGRFVLRGPAAGEYRLRAERIGYAATESEPFRLEEGLRTTQRMAAGDARVRLDAITVSTRSRCAPRPGSSAGTAAVWEEVRKALDGVRSTRAGREGRFTLELYERDVDPQSGAVTGEERRTVEGVAEQPFVTVDPARLAEAGFIELDDEGYRYAAPDAEVVLSERFLEDHCFALRTAGAPSPGLIGLAFQPVRGRRVPDVEGVLWVDRATAELRRMEFAYTRPPVRGPRGVPGGTIEFQRLPDGRWLTSAWQLRMPVVGIRDAYTIGEQSRHLHAIREVGGSARPGSVPRAPAPPPVPAIAAVPDAVADEEEEAPAATPAAAARSARPPASTLPPDRRRLLTRAEVDRSSAPTATELVQTLRPQWLRARGNDATRARTAPLPGGITAVLIDEAPVVVYLDGTLIGLLEALRTIRRVEIEEVEYYDAGEAQQRWGTGHQHGAINVVTRRP